jgi:hypothetical protein
MRQDATGIANAPEHHDTVYVRAWKDGYDPTVRDGEHPLPATPART